VSLFPKPSFSYECEGDAQLKTASTRRPGPVATSRTRRPTTCSLRPGTSPLSASRSGVPKTGQLSAEIVSWFDVVAFHVGAAGTLPSSERTEACLGC
jgi:hypothetical protein